MANSTKPAKPSKPYEGFPLYAHASRKWAKKIRGKLHYFGKWEDPQAALDEYLDQRDELHAGRIPKARQETTEIRDLVNEFLTCKADLLATGEIAESTFADYHETCERIIKAFGRRRPASDLSASDFHRFRQQLAKTLGPVSLGNEINRVRIVFRFGIDSELIPSPVRYGQSFKRPSAKVLRIARANGVVRMFEADELRKILNNSSNPVRAFVLLGINAGLGASDVAQMPAATLSDAVCTGWLNYPRPKTGVARRVPLWTETIEALTSMVGSRPKPKEAKYNGLAFLTHSGLPWVRLNRDPLGFEFKKLQVRLGTCRPGRGFYSFRHTFQTTGDRSRDPVAVSHCMGHTDNSMAGRYRERIDDDRLQAVADVIHAWLFGKDGER